jgi:F-type H+-transporting ATPase subunit b
MRPTAAVIAVGYSLLSSAAFAAEQKEGMPQLDFANPLTLAQVVWLAIIFFALYVVLSRWALPQVAAVLEARAATIGADLEAARSAKLEADAAVAELTEANIRAHATAQAEIGAALAQAKQAAQAQSAELNARLDSQLKDAEQRIAASRAAALGALRQVSTDAAETVVSRLTGLAPDAASVERAVGNVLALRGIA